MGRGQGQTEQATASLLFGPRAKAEGPRPVADLRALETARAKEQLELRLAKLIGGVREKQPHELRRYTFSQDDNWQAYSTSELEKVRYEYAAGGYRELRLVCAEGSPQDWDKPEEKPYGFLVIENGYKVGVDNLDNYSPLYTSAQEAVAAFNAAEQKLVDNVQLKSWGFREKPAQYTEAELEAKLQGLENG